MDNQGIWYGLVAKNEYFTHYKLEISENNFTCWSQTTFNTEKPTWPKNPGLTGKFFLRDSVDEHIFTKKYFRIVFFPDDHLSKEKAKIALELGNHIIYVENEGFCLISSMSMSKI